jgi:hypothetical protein
MRHFLVFIDMTVPLLYAPPMIPFRKHKAIKITMKQDMLPTYSTLWIINYFLVSI